MIYESNSFKDLRLISYMHFAFAKKKLKKLQPIQKNHDSCYPCIDEKHDAIPCLHVNRIVLKSNFLPSHSQPNLYDFVQQQGNKKASQFWGEFLDWNQIKCVIPFQIDDTRMMPDNVAMLQEATHPDFVLIVRCIDELTDEIVTTFQSTVKKLKVVISLTKERKEREG